MKAVWIFFLIILPILTSLVYLIARGKEMTERNVARSRRRRRTRRPTSARSPVAAALAGRRDRPGQGLARLRRHLGRASSEKASRATERSPGAVGDRPGRRRRADSTRQPSYSASRDQGSLREEQVQPRRTSTNGGLRCSRRSRARRRTNVTTGCWVTQTASASSPRRRHSATTPGRRSPRPRSTPTRRGRDPVTGACAGRDVVDRRVGAPGPAQLLDRGDGGVGFQEPGSSQSTIGSPPARSSARQGRVVAVLVEVVEPQDGQPEPVGEVRLARPGGAGEDDDAR